MPSNHIVNNIDVANDIFHNRQLYKIHIFLASLVIVFFCRKIHMELMLQICYLYRIKIMKGSAIDA